MSGSAANCANCGATLGGAFCSACGQRADHHVLSIGEFLAEAVEVFTHADSRLWRTFALLLTRPGYLTQQFIAGRRASYLPPFRLYVVLSVVFFLVVPLTSSIGPTAVLSPEARAQLPDRFRATLQQEIDSTEDPEEKAVLQAQLRDVEAVRSRLAPLAGAGAGDAAAGEAGAEAPCRNLVAGTTVPAWVAARAIHACEKLRADNGRALGHSLLHNLGRAMLVMLPVLALVMKLMYWRAGRLYVEHLILLLHNHALVFLGMSVLLLATHFLPSDAFAATLGGAFALYVTWYLYESMRRVYGQGRFSTLLRFWGLATAYSICALLMFVLALLYSAATLE